MNALKYLVHDLINAYIGRYSNLCGIFIFANIFVANCLITFTLLIFKYNFNIISNLLIEIVKDLDRY